MAGGTKGKGKTKEVEPKRTRQIRAESPDLETNNDEETTEIRAPKRAKQMTAAVTSSQPHDYTHLLQPIRDLAANWAVDLANELEDYIAEIEKITYSFDGLNNLNFAEAALLIQGSACVYSRKVEHLYNLVYQTLELVSSKRKPQQSSLDEDGLDKDANAEADDAPFLTLDDMEASNNIDLVEEGPRARQKAALLKRTPIAFMPQLEKAISSSSNIDLVSATGDVIGKRDDFKMNTSMIHESGALILDTSDFHLMDKNLRPILPGRPSAAVGVAYHGAMGEAVAPGSPIPASRAAVGSGDDYANNDDHYDDGGDDDFGMDTGGWPAGPDQELDIASPTFAGLGHHARAHQRANESLGDYVDPWAMVDPHNKGSMPEKPFKKGKTFRLPKILTEKRTPLGESQSVNKVLPTVTQFLAQIKSLQKIQKTASKNTIKGSLYPEFDYLYAQESKRRKAVIQKEKEQLELTVRRGNDNWNSIPPIADFGGGFGDDDGDDDDHYYDHDDPYPTQGQGERQAAEADGHDLGPAHGHQDMMDEDNVVPPMALDEPDPDHAETETYEDMCRHQIENYLAQAQKYDQHLETSLSKRVREWEDKIKPLLGEQDSRPYFNVRETGQQVLDQFQKLGVKEKGALSLSAVVGSEPQMYEVIRVFMASLHLANSGNVDIKVKGTEMNLVLKSTALHELEV